MDKLIDKSRRHFTQWHNNAQSADNGSHSMYSGYQHTTPPPPVHLPPAFSDVHPSLARYAEQIKLSSPLQVPFTSAQTSHLSQGQAAQGGPESPPSDAWLPDIYQFTSVGVGIEERYTFASAQPTPFIPSSPRIAENANFNFDHGALTADLAETSYMAWF